jgi:hypothetical protein
MLSVGREINIETRNLLCRKCAWQGRGAELSTGLIRINQTQIYLYAYRCPECGSFDLAAKAKVLAFRPRVSSVTSDTIQRSAGQDRQNGFATEKLKRLWQ